MSHNRYGAYRTNLLYFLLFCAILFTCGCADAGNENAKSARSTGFSTFAIPRVTASEETSPSSGSSPEAENQFLFSLVEQLLEDNRQLRRRISNPNWSEPPIPTDAWSVKDDFPFSIDIKNIYYDGMSKCRITLTMYDARRALPRQYDFPSELYGSPSGLFMPQKGKSGIESKPFISFWLIDYDNVRIAEIYASAIEGAITFEKKDSIRLLLNLPDKSVIDRTARVVMRKRSSNP